jgi:protein phosphatase
MSIAVISDIHGNITALEAVLDYLKERQIKRIFCLGDLVGKGPNSKEVIARVKESCEVVVRGNWDDFIQKPADFPDLRWHQEQIGNEGMDYLNTLPFHHDFRMSGKYIRLFHASAKSIYHRVVPMHHPIEEREAMFGSSEFIDEDKRGNIPDVVGYGDIHAAMLEPIDPKKILFNTGSVGNPLDVPEASFAILHGAYLSEEPAPFSIEMVRVPYDIEKEIDMARQMGMPNLAPYALELREAIYRGRQKA